MHAIEKILDRNRDGSYASQADRKHHRRNTGSEASVTTPRVAVEPNLDTRGARRADEGKLISFCVLYLILLKQKNDYRNVSYQGIDDFFTDELLRKATQHWQSTLGAMALNLPLYEVVIEKTRVLVAKLFQGNLL